MGFCLTSYAASCGVPDPEGFVTRCRQLREILADANRSMNLTRITEPEEFAIKHIADSIAIARAFPFLISEHVAVADIGCGAGFPSLALALAFSNLRLTAIDSTGKKASFVMRAAEALELKNIRVIHGRSGEIAHRPEIRCNFDVVTARAVAPAPTICRDAKDFLKRKGGRFILYRTPQQAEKELPMLESACQKLPFLWHATEPFELPGDAGKRLFLFSEPR